MLDRERVLAAISALGRGAATEGAANASPASEQPPRGCAGRQWKDTQHGPAFVKDTLFALDHLHGSSAARPSRRRGGVTAALGQREPPLVSRLAFFDTETTGSREELHLPRGPGIRGRRSGCGSISSRGSRTARDADQLCRHGAPRGRMVSYNGRVRPSAPRDAPDALSAPRPSSTSPLRPPAPCGALPLSHARLLLGEAESRPWRPAAKRRPDALPSFRLRGRAAPVPPQRARHLSLAGRARCGGGLFARETSPGDIAIARWGSSRAAIARSPSRARSTPERTPAWTRGASRTHDPEALAARGKTPCLLAPPLGGAI